MQVDREQAQLDVKCMGWQGKLLTLQVEHAVSDLLHVSPVWARAASIRRFVRVAYCLKFSTRRIFTLFTRRPFVSVNVTACTVCMW